VKARVSILLSAMGMLACSTPPSSPPPAAAPEFPALVSGIEIRPAPEYRSEVQGFTACQLGAKCMALDPRPFEMCLLSGNRCSDKLGDSILVDGPLTAPPEPMEVSR
jgi:hypothetical protein